MDGLDHAHDLGQVLLSPDGVEKLEIHLGQVLSDNLLFGDFDVKCLDHAQFPMA